MVSLVSSTGTPVKQGRKRCATRANVGGASSLDESHFPDSVYDSKEFHYSYAAPSLCPI